MYGVLGVTLAALVLASPEMAGQSSFLPSKTHTYLPIPYLPRVFNMAVVLGLTEGISLQVRNLDTIQAGEEMKPTKKPETTRNVEPPKPPEIKYGALEIWCASRPKCHVPHIGDKPLVPAGCTVGERLKARKHLQVAANRSTFRLVLSESKHQARDSLPRGAICSKHCRSLRYG